MILEEMVEKNEDTTRISIYEFVPDGNPDYVFGASGDYVEVFEGTIGGLKKSRYYNRDFYTRCRQPSDWYVDITGRLQVTM